MDLFGKFFIAYWIIGWIFVLISVGDTNVKKVIKDDPLAYICAALIVSILYPIALIRAINERRKTKDEGSRND